MSDTSGFSFSDLNNVSSNGVSTTTNAGSSSDDTLSSADNGRLNYFKKPRNANALKKIKTQLHEDTLDYDPSKNGAALQLQKLSDKAYIGEFLERVGYGEAQKSNLQKWACKNCLFGFVRDLLATSQGDNKFVKEVEQSEFMYVK